MQQIKELLVGYCDPVQLKISDRPIGETGLTTRLRIIAESFQVSKSLRRKHLWELAMENRHDLFMELLGSVELSWLTELLRILDKPYSFGDPNKPNLTVALCHERLQSEASISAQDKALEQKLFDAVMAKYNAAALRECRNKEMFHLSLKENLRAPARTGNVYAVTEAALDWYKHVATIVFGVEPLFVIPGGAEAGKKVVKDFRQVMLDALRYRKLARKMSRFRR